MYFISEDNKMLYLHCKNDSGNETFSFVYSMFNVHHTIQFAVEKTMRSQYGNKRRKKAEDNNSEMQNGFLLSCYSGAGMLWRIDDEQIRFSSESAQYSVDSVNKIGSKTNKEEGKKGKVG